MNILDNLKIQGYRITSQRRKVLKAISTYPQSVEEIFEKLHEEVDLVSVYRTLDLFVKNNIVYDVDFGDGKKRYELVHDDKHHHHIICNDCGKVEDVNVVAEANLIYQVKKQTDFEIKTHSLEFFGLCTSCQI